MADSRNPSPKKPRKALLALTAIVSALIAVVAIELGLAVFHPIPHSIERNMFFVSDPHTGYRLKPNSVGTFHQGILAKVNSLGLRDDEVTVEKPQGVYRILMLGDSFTVGANVTRKQAYPQVLEALLDDRSERVVEVINTGVGGWEPFMYAQYFEHHGQAFDADLVLIGFFVGNDTYDQSSTVEQLPTTVLGRRVSRDAAAEAETPLLVFLHEHSHLTRLLRPKGPRSLEFTRKNCTDFSEEYIATQRLRLPSHLRRKPKREAMAGHNIRQIRRIKDLAAKTGSPVLVVLIPDENQINPDLQAIVLRGQRRARYDFKMPQSMLKELFQAQDIPTIDLLPAFRADPRCLYMNDTHWTPEGHQLAAKIISEQTRLYLKR